MLKEVIAELQTLGLVPMRGSKWLPVGILRLELSLEDVPLTSRAEAERCRERNVYASTRREGRDGEYTMGHDSCSTGIRRVIPSSATASKDGEGKTGLKGGQKWFRPGLCDVSAPRGRGMDDSGDCALYATNGDGVPQGYAKDDGITESRRGVVDN